MTESISVMKNVKNIARAVEKTLLPSSSTERALRAGTAVPGPTRFHPASVPKQLSLARRRLQ